MNKKRYLVKLLRLGAVLGLLLGLFVVAPILAISGVNGDSPASADFAPDHILVKFKPGTVESAKRDIHGRRGGQVVGEIAALGVQVVKVPPGQVKQKAKDYAGEKSVQYAEPDYVGYPADAPNDTFFVQWGLAKIRAPEAWDITTGTTGSSGVKIAILDTGIDQDHEDLASKIVANVNFGNSLTEDDLFGHGTHVAGIAAAATDNGIGVAGVGYNSSLMNVKVFDDNGVAYAIWVTAGIVWAADNGAKVINMSIAFGVPSDAMRDAINYAWGKGLVLVAAAGNTGQQNPVYPAYYPNVIAVAATDANDAKASFSTYGFAWVDVAAPGLDIFSTSANHPTSQNYGLNYATLSGTSMASPCVAGLAGLVWATQWGTPTPDDPLRNDNVRSRIEATADQAGPMWSQYGIKRINAFAAVSTPTLLSISVTPGSPSIQEGLTQQFAATGNYSDNTTADLTATASWTSSNTAVATINASGLASGVGPGSTTITATQEGVVSNPAALTVTVPPTLVSIAVTPSSANIPQGSTKQFTAAGTYGDGSTADLTTTATWASDNAPVATINASGLATGVGVGTAGITATQVVVSNRAALTVTAPPTPPTPTPTPGPNIFADGFEFGIVPPWTGSYTSGSGGPSIARSDVQKKESSYSAKATLPAGGNAYAWKTLPGSYRTLYVRAYVYVESFDTTLGYANGMLALRTTTPDATIVSLGLRDDRGGSSFSLWVNFGGTDYAVYAAPGVPMTITPGTWYCIELASYRDSSQGWVKVWVNNELKLDRTGNTGTGDFSQIRVGLNGPKAATSTVAYFDAVAVAPSFIDPLP